MIKTLVLVIGKCCCTVSSVHNDILHNNFKKRFHSLYYLSCRCLLHNCFQAVMDHGCPLASDLAQAFRSLCSSACGSSISAKNSIIQLGFALGG